ncbi:hypothetical protein [Winogradskyella aurantiaca]|uniref:hypothetical protein n=1 Tax=Winogradskyella aurantiaca TaxID=2219558 RepID=UPI000E1C85AE|nr:hypothetical protein [Winogradskyella aurantiaca]
MKLKLLIAILLFCGIKSYASGFKTFVPKEDGYFPVEIKVEKKSINNICKFLGYNPEQFYTYNDFDLKDSKVFIVIFKSFSDKIICVLTEDTVESIEQKDVSNYLVNFNLKDDFDSYDVESTLEDGVKNKSLSNDFIGEVFNNQISENDSFVAVEFGYELNFKNGVLTSYNSSDGLNKWAKSWKNEMPERYREYYNEASRHQTDETDILKELNAQADAFANTPYGVMNEYIKFHTNESGIVNYKMLLVAHYNQTIKLDEFKLINKGRYELSNEFNDQDNYKRTTYRVNKGLYSFDEKGDLINSYTSN